MFFVFLILVILILGIAYIVFYNNYKVKLAKNLSFMLVKIPKKDSDIDKSNDTIQSMKNNIQIMEQVYKNFYSIFDSSIKWKFLPQKWISLNMVVEKELIKFIVWVPKEFKDSFEKTISSFYPGSSIDDITPPRMLEAWKYWYWGYLVLVKDDAFPIKNYEKFEADPMDSILSSFSRVNYEEKLQLQILMQPISESWQVKFRKKIKQIKSGGFWWNLFNFSTKNNKNQENVNLSSTQLQDMEAKVQDEWFNVVFKVFANSPKEDRPKKLVQDLVRSMSQYNYIGMNQFVFLEMKNLEKFGKEFVMHIFKKPIFTFYKFLFFIKAQILNIKELASIYHFPHSRFNKNPRIVWQKFKIVPAPDNVPKEGLLLWYNVYSWVKKEIRISPLDRFRHFYVIWQTGTGKSTMITVQAKQDVQLWNGFAIIDPHGDLCETIIQYYPKERINDLIYFDAGDFDNPFGLNLLEPSSPDNYDEIDLITNDATELFIKLYWPEIFWPRIQDYFRNAVMTLMEQPDGGSLVEIMRLFTDEAYQKVKVSKVKNPVVKAWWEKTYKAMWEREKAEIIPYFQAKFGPLTTNWILRNIIWQVESSFKIDEVMQQWKVLLVNLSKGKIWEINSQLLGLIMVSKIKQAALARAKMPPEERRDFFLYIDEFQNYVTPSIESILSEARKYRLWLIIAHQYIEQLKQKDLWGETDLTWAIFGNVWTIMAYKVWAKDAEYLEQEFAPEFSKQDLVNIDRFKAIMKLSINTQPSRPFTINVLNPYTEEWKNDPKKCEIIKQISALKYGRDRKLVEKEIFYRVGG